MTSREKCSKNKTCESLSEKSKLHPPVHSKCQWINDLVSNYSSLSKKHKIAVFTRPIRSFFSTPTYQLLFQYTYQFFGRKAREYIKALSIRIYNIIFLLEVGYTQKGGL